MACLDITGVMKAATMVAVQVLLGLSPLCLQLEAETRAGIYRRFCSDQWNHKSEDFGHAYIEYEEIHPADGC
jgi:hypothetical protein